MSKKPAHMSIRELVAKIHGNTNKIYTIWTKRGNDLLIPPDDIVEELEVVLAILTRLRREMEE